MPNGMFYWLIGVTWLCGVAGADGKSTTAESGERYSKIRDSKVLSDLRYVDHFKKQKQQHARSSANHDTRASENADTRTIGGGNPAALNGDSQYRGTASHGVSGKEGGQEVAVSKKGARVAKVASDLEFAAYAAKRDEESSSILMSNTVFVAVVAGCSVAGVVGVVVAGVCWYRLQKNVEASSEVEYPAYGQQGSKEAGSPGDRKLAQSAQMYHYQHQKQQMIAMQKANGETRDANSDEDSDEENDEGDYTVYECPGLAPTGEMEVKNPLFTDHSATSPAPSGGDTTPQPAQ